MKIPKNIPHVKAAVEQLLGKTVSVSSCRGRSKCSAVGVLDAAHNNVFTVKLSEGQGKTASFSYVEVMCGEILLKEVAEK